MTLDVKTPGATVRDPALRAELRDLYEDYAAALDDLRLDDWVAYFTEGSLYRVMGRETFDQELTHATIFCQGLPMIRDRAAAVHRTAVYEPRHLRHFVSGVRVVGFSNGEIEAEGNFMISEAMFDREARLFLTGQYKDRLVRTKDGLRFRERTAVYDNHAIPTTLIIPV
jgi:anthranilate 1,2-dioxygenase small subunit